MDEVKERIRMIVSWQIRLQGVLLACGLSAVLAGCGSSSLNNKIVDNMPSAVGLPDDAPARPEASPAYPAVHDMPPPRATATLSAEEQEKLEHDLASLRTRQAATTGVTPVAAKRKSAPAAAPPRIIPTNTSSNSIY